MAHSVYEQDPDAYQVTSSYLNKHALVLHVTWETFWVALMQDGQRICEKLVLNWQARLWLPVQCQSGGDQTFIRLVEKQHTGYRHQTDLVGLHGKTLPLLKGRPKQNGIFLFSWKSLLHYQKVYNVIANFMTL